MKGVLKFPPHEEVFNLVHERENGRTGIYAEATMLDAKLNLKNWLTRIYLGKTFAGALISTGIKPLIAAGRALELAMEALELKVEQEYLTLQALHEAATKLMPVKQLLRDVLLPAAKRYTTAVVRSAGRSIEQRNGGRVSASRTAAAACADGSTGSGTDGPGDLTRGSRTSPIGLWLSC
jgi:hypothetical protein